MEILDINVSPDTFVYEGVVELYVGDVEVSATEEFTGWLDLVEDAGGRFVLTDNRLNTTRFHPADPGDYTIRVLASTQSGLEDTFEPGVSFEKDIVIHVLAPYQMITGITLDTPDFIANGFPRKVATIAVSVDTGRFGNRSRSVDVGSTAFVDFAQTEDVYDFEIPDLAPGVSSGPRNNELWVRRGVDEPREYRLQLTANWDGALNSGFRQGVTIAGTPHPPGDLLWLFGNVVPGVVSSDDPYAVEVGVQFTPMRDGGILGLRFYKCAQNVGPHYGHLWDTEGNLLATAEFINPTTEGWQQRLFSPVMVTAGEIYVASYHAPSGHYSADQGFFVETHLDHTGWLVAPASPMIDRGNGVFTYSDTPGVFPVSTFRATNYYVDIVFLPQGWGPPP